MTVTTETPSPLAAEPVYCFASNAHKRPASLDTAELVLYARSYTMAADVHRTTADADAVINALLDRLAKCVPKADAIADQNAAVGATIERIRKAAQWTVHEDLQEMLILFTSPSGEKHRVDSHWWNTAPAGIRDLLRSVGKPLRLV